MPRPRSWRACSSPAAAHGAGLDLLAGGRYLPPRQQTLRETIAWSYDLLTPTEQRVFRCLGVFAGGCTLEALQAVLAHGAYATDDNHAPANATRAGDTWLRAALHALVNQSLVLQAQGPDHAPRFSLLEMLREYALEQLAQQPEAAAVQRAHAEYYLQVAAHFRAATGAGAYAAVIDRTEAEVDNLRAGLQWAEEHDFALEVSFAEAIAEFWSQGHHLSAGRQWLEDLLPRLKAAAASLQPQQLAQYAYLSGSLALFTWLQGDTSLAQSRYEETIALWRQLQNWQELGAALNFWACVRCDQGAYAAAAAAAQESVQILRAAGASTTLGWALCTVGKISTIRSDYATAQACFEEAEAIFQRDSNPWSLGPGCPGPRRDLFCPRRGFPRLRLPGGCPRHLSPGAGTELRGADALLPGQSALAAGRAQPGRGALAGESRGRAGGERQALHG